MKKTQEAIDESKRQCRLGREYCALVLAGFSWQWLRTSTYFQSDTSWPLDISSSNPSQANPVWLSVAGWTEQHGSQRKNIKGKPLALIQDVLEASNAVSCSNEVACFWRQATDVTPLHISNWCYWCLSISFRSTPGNIGGGCIVVMLFVEGAVAVKSDLIIKCNAERKLWNCSVIIYEVC